MSFDRAEGHPLAKAETGAGSGGQAPTIIDAAAGADRLVMPDGFGLLSASFARAGADLVLTAPDGARVLVQGYFDLAPPPALMTPGGAMIWSELAQTLAGPIAPGQYAQAEETLEAQPIGRVEETAGTVRVTHADGTQDTLGQDSAVYQGDLLVTGEDAAIAITFVDETAFSLGENARMVLDELIFDPSTLEGSSSFSVLEGVFVFVSGEIAANNPDEMIVRTPVATIGIRGTKVGGQAGQEGDVNSVVLFPLEGTTDTPSGSITYQTIGAQLEGEEPLVISQAYHGASVSSIFDSPTSFEIAPDDLVGFIQQLTGALPRSTLLNPISETGEHGGGAGDELSGPSAESLAEIAPASGGDQPVEAGDATFDPEFDTVADEEEAFLNDLLEDLFVPPPL